MDESDKPFTDEEREAFIDQMQQWMDESHKQPDRHPKGPINLDGIWFWRCFLDEPPEKPDEQAHPSSNTEDS